MVVSGIIRLVMPPRVRSDDGIEDVTMPLNLRCDETSECLDSSAELLIAGIYTYRIRSYMGRLQSWQLCDGFRREAANYRLIWCPRLTWENPWRLR